MNRKIEYDVILHHVTDMVEEYLIKLGYEETSIGLYYPIDSLNRMLGTKLSVDEMEEFLLDMVKDPSAEDTLGAISISHDGDRFCLRIPAGGVTYVYHHKDKNEFLEEFIATTTKHGCSIDDLKEVFHHHAEDVVCEKIECEDFDYLLYFKDGMPDAYRYCIKFEGEHTTYHRFTAKDYEALFA